ncbi:MAG: protein kinase [Anaerolineales bacterium]|nr:protein kinase [Anaerolineales bacterium]
MIGTTLQNRYRLTAELGRGGMGTVYRARDEVLQRDVAVKVLADPGLGAAGRARLLQEARAAARLNHPNIVSVHDAGEADGLAFIVLELVEGASLYERWPLPLEQTVAVARQVCAALEHAHAHGVIHRDLKPENVVLTPDGTAKLMDFGLARAAVAGRATPEEAVLGTVYYLAPEQVTGQLVDGRADLYALGVMLYELTTGQLPFTGADPIIIVSQHIHAPPPPPSTHRADLPPALEAVILRLLAKDPAERFADAGEVAAALGQVWRPAGTAGGRAAGLRHNLPLQLTRFIGREREMREVRSRLAAARLVSLTGSGGCGKTRLALQVAEAWLSAEAGANGGQPVFPDGIWLVELGPITDPALLPQTVAALLNVREEPGHALLKTLTDALRPRALLLILDNCEHLIDAGAQFAEAVLRACPDVRILATSREALGIAGEVAYRVPSLSSPDPEHPPEPAALDQFEAVRLFVDRAAAIKPDFALTPANAAAVIQVCGQLDGLPLALELAAARIRAMTVEQIAARLDDRFRLLTGGSRTALPRQQTLRALIDWSWELLSAPERALLRRLAVFLGGWTLEAAEAVCAEAAEAAPQPALAAGDILDLLAHLVDKSLVLVDETSGHPRYRMLETIRQYARERLLESGEAAGIRAQHLAYFQRLAAKAEPELRAAGQLTWIERLEAEHDNLRAALKWSLSSQALEAGLRLAGDLARFWYLRGFWREGRQWLEQLLGRAAAAPAEARAWALCGAAWLANEDGSDIALYESALALYRAEADHWGEAYALRGLAAAWWAQGKLAEARGPLAESRAIFHELEDAWGLGLVALNQGWLAFSRDETAQAEPAWQAGLEHFRRSGDRWGIATTLSGLGYILRLRGDYPQAAAVTEESLGLYRELGDKAGVAMSLLRLASLAFRRGEYPQARDLAAEGYALARERGDVGNALSALALLGQLAYLQGDYARAEHLLDEALAESRANDDVLTLASLLYHRAHLAYLQRQLDSAETLFQECLQLLPPLEERLVTGLALLGLGAIACRRGTPEQARGLLEQGRQFIQESGDQRFYSVALAEAGRHSLAAGAPAEAARHFRASLRLRREMGDRQGVAEALEGLAGAAGSAERAARLLAAARALRELIGAPLPPVDQPDYARLADGLGAALGEAGWAAAEAAGRRWTLDEAVQAALDEEA